MLSYMWLILLYGVVGALAQDCQHYEPTVSLATSPHYVGLNVTLHCTGDAPDALSVEWKMMGAGSASPRDVYKENLTDPGASFTYPEFQGKVVGKYLSPDPLNHSLVLLQVGADFNLSEWQCDVKTFQCSAGKTSQPANLELRTPFLHEPVLRDSVGNVLHDGSQLEPGAAISCEAAADPAAVLTFTGDALEDVEEVGCEEQEGEGWLCSSQAQFSNEGDVQCEASQPELNTIVQIKAAILHKDDGTPEWVIALIVIIICIIGGIGGLVYKLYRNRKDNNRQ